MQVKVFQDDMQDAIRNANEGFVPLGDSLLFGHAGKMVEAYFQEKIELVVNNEAVEFWFDDYQVEGDSYWIAFEYDSPVEWQSLEVRAAYFMELFPTQQNILQVKTPKTSFCRLTVESASCSIDFD